MSLPHPTSPPLQVEDEADGGKGDGMCAGGGVGLPPEASAALHQGAFHLMACCTPVELQHLHAVLGPGVGGARKAALATMKKQYDRGFKYTGKV